MPERAAVPDADVPVTDDPQASSHGLGAAAEGPGAAARGPGVAAPAPESSSAATPPRPDASNAGKSERDPAEGVEEDVIRPGSLRIDKQVGEELFGALYSGIETRGPATFGDHNTIVNHIAGRTPTPTIWELPYVAELMDVYVDSDADKELKDLLAVRSTGCVTGMRNSGRFTTACVALGRRHAPNSVHEITLPTGTPPEALVGQADDVHEGCGYVLRLPGGDPVDAMRKLAGLFRRKSASLLLIKDEEPHERELHGAEVRHRPPDPVAVFRKHLEGRLRKRFDLPPSKAADEVDSYLERDGLRAELKKVHGPKESVAIAQAIGEKHPVDDTALQVIMARAQPRRRLRARKILLPPQDRSTSRRRAEQHERAFRIAYAVFRLRPLHYVFEAASWLLEEIDEAALRPEWGRMALQHPVQELLGDELKKDWAEGRDAANAMLGASRVAWIRDGGMRGAILDVAWHDFDSTRKSLLQWLDRLVRKGDEVMKRAAAETAALLAHHDFDRVHAELIDGWAAAPSPRVRQAAAWTEAIADLTGNVGHLVRAKLSQWCSGTNFTRDTAARLYASGLQQPVLAWSMADLRRIAQDRMQRRSHAVAEAVNQLYGHPRAKSLVAELATWTSDDRARPHAARALVALAARSSPDVGDSRPELLVRLADGEVATADLAVVWRAALIEPDVSTSAWPVLSDWLRQADVDVGLRKDVASLLRAVVARRGMHRRVEFFLRRTADFKDGLPEWTRLEMRSSDE
ncbi:hypothetical protein WEI85_23700 [Actinomycetes bacterium KLBMP 9797]